MKANLLRLCCQSNDFCGDAPRLPEASFPTYLMSILGFWMTSFPSAREGVLLTLVMPCPLQSSLCPQRPPIHGVDKRPEMLAPGPLWLLPSPAHRVGCLWKTNSEFKADQEEEMRGNHDVLCHKRMTQQRSYQLTSQRTFALEIWTRNLEFGAGRV